MNKETDIRKQTAYLVRYEICNGVKRNKYWYLKHDKQTAINMLGNTFLEQQRIGFPISDYSITEVEIVPVAKVKLDF